MVEDKIVKRKKEIIKLSKGFCKKYLDTEFGDLCEDLVEDLSNLDDVPFKRGKLEIWASGVVHRIATTNMLFDALSNYQIKVKDISNYFNTKEPTIFAKSKTILNFFDEDEFNEKYCLMVLTPRDVIALRNSDGSILKVNMDFNKNRDKNLFFNAILSVYYGGDTEKALEMIASVPKTAEEYPKALSYKLMIYIDEDRDGENEIFQELEKNYPGEWEKNMELLMNDSMDVDESENFEDPSGGYLITLQLYTSTLVWREVKIPDNITFKHLHNLIQKIFNFDNYHMWEFEVPEKIDDESVDLNNVARRISSDEAGRLKISEIFDDNIFVLYRYDMGDNWEIVITKHKNIEYTSKSAEITDYDGKYSPMDDMGGTFVFEEIMECIDDKETLEYTLEDYGMDLSDLEKMDFEKRFKKGSKITL